MCSQWHLMHENSSIMCNLGPQNLSFDPGVNLGVGSYSHSHQSYPHIVTISHHNNVSSVRNAKNANNVHVSDHNLSNGTSSTNGLTSTGSPSSSTSGGPAKSTKGASKMRRDMINHEISHLRDLLPLPSSTRQRLSQLQLMALVCVYVRKSNYFDQVFKGLGKMHHIMDSSPPFGFSKALNGFLMMTTQTGKLLYISDNAAEYLGHSMEDLLIHGDSVYDIIDKQDHASIQAELNRNVTNGLGEFQREKRIFLCRMNVSRNSRRQMRFGDQKVVLIEGRFSGLLPLCSRSEPVFISWCTPIAMPETRESLVQGATNIFTSTHTMDFKFTSIDENGEHYLGYTKKELDGLSFYNILHPESIKDVQSKHRLITQSENEKSSILLIQLQHKDGSSLWCHTVIQAKESCGTGSPPSSSTSDCNNDQSSLYILCTNQILTREEAAVMRANNWLYHYYMVQSRLQYNLAYGGQPSAIAALYPQMMHIISPTNPQSQTHQQQVNEQMGDYESSIQDQYTPNGNIYDSYGFSSFTTRYHHDTKFIKDSKDLDFISYYQQHQHTHQQHLNPSPHPYHLLQTSPDSRSDTSTPTPSTHIDSNKLPLGLSALSSNTHTLFPSHCALNGGVQSSYRHLHMKRAYYDANATQPMEEESEDHTEDDNNNCENKKSKTAKHDTK